MYNLIIKDGTTIISEKAYSSREEIENFLYDEYHEDDFEFEIVDSTTGDILDEGEIENSDDINSMIMEQMFPDEDDLEGFDWTLE